MSLLTACVRASTARQIRSLPSLLRPFASLGRSLTCTPRAESGTRFSFFSAPALAPRPAVASPSTASRVPGSRRALRVWDIDKKDFESTLSEPRAGHQIELLHGRIRSKEEREAVLAHTNAVRFFGGLDGYPVDVVRGCEHLRQAADAGFAPAMVLLAHHYLMGVGVPFDALEGVRLLRVAAEGGCLEAQVELARVLIVASRTRDDPFLARRCEYVTGSQRNHLHGAMRAAKDIGGDAREGVRLLEEAAAAGNESALVKLGIIHVSMALDEEMPTSEVLQPDGDRGILLLRKAAAAGNHGPLFALGSALIRNPKTEAEGEELLRQNAAKGSYQSCAVLSQRLVDSQDPAAAAEGRAFARRAAEAGDVDGMYFYAYALVEGKGGAGDVVEGAKWLLRAGESGHVVAQTILGMAHASGNLGFAVDSEKSRHWHTLAALGGSPFSQRILALDLMKAPGDDASKAEALFWMEKSAKSGDRQSLFCIGSMYVVGFNVPKQPAKGWATIRLAAEAGDEMALLNLGFAMLSGTAFPYVVENVPEGEKMLRHATALGSAHAKAVLAGHYRVDPSRREEGEAMLKEALEANPAVLEELVGLLLP